MKSYIEDTDPESALSVGADMRKINYCFQLLKVMITDCDSPAFILFYAEFLWQISSRNGSVSFQRSS